LWNYLTPVPSQGLLTVDYFARPGNYKDSIAAISGIFSSRVSQKARIRAWPLFERGAGIRSIPTNK
jgi:hypothetical protein